MTQRTDPINQATAATMFTGWSPNTGSLFAVFGVGTYLFQEAAERALVERYGITAEQAAAVVAGALTEAGR